MSAGRWTQDVYLMRLNPTPTAKWEKLVCISEYPDLGGEPEQIESTTMCDLKNRTYENGLQDLASFQFVCNATPANKAKLVAAQNADRDEPGTYAIWFSTARDADNPNHEDDAWYWQGRLSYWVTGKSINELATYTIAISVSSELYDNEDPSGTETNP